MESASFTIDRVIGATGLILALVLVFLDKAGKLRGGLLYTLLIIAFAMTLFLTLRNPWVLQGDTRWDIWRGCVAFSVTFLVFGAVAAWTYPAKEIDESYHVTDTQVQLSLTCEIVPLPMIGQGDIWIFHTFNGGGLGKLSYPNKAESAWPARDANGIGYKCMVKNYGTQAAFDLSFSLNVAELNVIRGPGTETRSGNPKNTFISTLYIPQTIGQQGNDPFTFYICSYDNDTALEVTVPSIAFINSGDHINKKQVDLRIIPANQNQLSIPQQNPFPHPEKVKPL